MKKETIATLIALIFIMVLVTVVPQELMKNKIKHTEHQRSVETVCREWQYTYPQSDIYDDCVQRNTRYLDE